MKTFAQAMLGLAGLVLGLLLIGGIASAIRGYYIHDVKAYKILIMNESASTYSSPIKWISVSGHNQNGEPVTYTHTYDPPTYQASTEDILWKGEVVVQVQLTDTDKSYPCKTSSSNEQNRDETWIKIRGGSLSCYSF